MPDASHLLAFAAAAVVLAIIPGPGLIYVLARSLSGGTRAGLRSTVGTAAGGLAHVIAAAVGLSALVLASATAFEVLRWAGAAYLIYLGVQTLRGASDPPPNNDQAPVTHLVRQGVITEALNPKTALFFLALLPQFVQPERGPIALQLLALGAISVTLNSGAAVAVALASGRLSALLRASPRWWKRQRTASGALLIGLGGAAAASGARA